MATVRKPSSLAARKMRMAISLRFAASSLWIGFTFFITQAPSPTQNSILSRTRPAMQEQVGQPYTSPEALRECYARATEGFGWRSYQRPPAQGSKRRGIGFGAHNWI